MDLQALFDKCNSPEIDKQADGIKGICELTKEVEDEETTYAKIVESGCILRIIQLLSSKNTIEISLQSAWILANIASGDNTELVQKMVDLKVIPALVSLLKATDDIETQIKCLWALANIAGLAKYRDAISQTGIIEKLLRLVRAHTKDIRFVEFDDYDGQKQELLRSIAWFAAYLSDATNGDYAASHMEILYTLSEIDDEQIIDDNIFGFQLLAKGKEYKLTITSNAEPIYNCTVSEKRCVIDGYFRNAFNQQIPIDIQRSCSHFLISFKIEPYTINMGVLKRLFSFLDEFTFSAQRVLEILVNISFHDKSDDGEQRQKMIDFGILPKLKQIIECDDCELVAIRENALILLRNICKKQKMVQHVIKSNFFPILFQIVKNKKSPINILNQAMCIINISLSHKETNDYFIKHDIVSILWQFHKIMKELKHVGLIQLSLEGICYIFYTGSQKLQTVCIEFLKANDAEIELSKLLDCPAYCTEWIIKAIRKIIYELQTEQEKAWMNCMLNDLTNLMISGAPNIE